MLYLTGVTFYYFLNCFLLYQYNVLTNLNALASSLASITGPSLYSLTASSITSGLYPGCNFLSVLKSSHDVLDGIPNKSEKGNLIY